MGNYGWETVVFFCRRYHLVFSCHTGFDFTLFLRLFISPTGKGGTANSVHLIPPTRRPRAPFYKKGACAPPFKCATRVVEHIEIMYVHFVTIKQVKIYSYLQLPWVMCMLRRRLNLDVAPLRLPFLFFMPHSTLKRLQRNQRLEPRRHRHGKSQDKSIAIRPKCTNSSNNCNWLSPATDS